MPETVIIGGGIAGFVLALELHAIGRQCAIFEAAPRIMPLGVGINLLPYAVEHLERLGLLPQLAAMSMQPTRCIYASSVGQILFEEPTGRTAGHSRPQFSIHRADLHRLLMQTARERLGESSVILGLTCTGYRQDGETVAALFDDKTTVTGRILIGCDGIHSRIFRQMHPGREAIRRSDITMWRGLTPNMKLHDGHTMLRAGTVQNGKIVAYPVPSVGSGAPVLNWVVEKQTPQNEVPPSDHATPLHLERLFPQWDRSWLDLSRLFQTSQAIMCMPMTDRDPCPHWTHGRVALLGDAAHPMFPLGSNGAGQAVLDAAALARCLDEIDDPLDALTTYERIRRPAAERIVLSDRVGGPDVVLTAIEARTMGRRIPEIESTQFRREAGGLLADYRNRIDGSRADRTGT